MKKYYKCFSLKLLKEALKELCTKMYTPKEEEYWFPIEDKELLENLKTLKYEGVLDHKAVFKWLNTVYLGSDSTFHYRSAKFKDKDKIGIEVSVGIRPYATQVICDYEGEYKEVFASIVKAMIEYLLSLQDHQ